MYSRRGFLKLSLASLGAVYFPLSDPFAQAAAGDIDPHFFFQFLIPGGMDPSYFFDARPLDMKAKGLMQNYLNADPTPWDATGASTLATSLVDPLKAFKKNFSILNGVLMSPGFDGHDQNANLLLAGDPFGGESFIPHLNNLGSQKTTPIDAIQAGRIFSNITNEAKSIPLDANAMVQLKSHLGAEKSSDLKSKSDAFINSRYNKISGGPGQFAQTTHDLQFSFQGVPGLSEKLTNIKVDVDEQDPDIAFFKIAFDFFKQGVARSAIFTTSDISIDVHAPGDCKKVAESYAKIISKMTNLFKTMNTTPYDDKRSFMDVTTFMVASEFSRTMKQHNLDVDQTGTDHNTLNNSVLVGGKGIRCGQIIGSSDRATASEKVSKAHATMDTNAIKIMGRPFDFEKGISRADLPDTFKPEDYLAIGSVVNTLYSQFGVSKDKYRVVARNGATAPLVSTLLL